MGLLVLSPMLLLVSLAIKLDSRGPLFSIQIKHS
jgi:lipopolysaccharide/colanic/teichoic acid biosynthesis glycosyltransferase